MGAACPPPTLVRATWAPTQQTSCPDDSTSVWRPWKESRNYCGFKLRLRCVTIIAYSSHLYPPPLCHGIGQDSLCWPLGKGWGRVPKPASVGWKWCHIQTCLQHWITGVLWSAQPEPALTGLSARSLSRYPWHPKPRLLVPSENLPWSEPLQDAAETAIKPLILSLQPSKCPLRYGGAAGRPLGESCGATLPALSPVISAEEAAPALCDSRTPTSSRMLFCAAGNGSLAVTSIQWGCYTASPVVLRTVIRDIKGRRHFLHSPAWPAAAVLHVDLLLLWGERNEGGPSKINYRSFCFD